MKAVLTIGLTLILCIAASAQTVDRCGTMDALAQQLMQNPDLAESMHKVEVATQATIAAGILEGRDVVVTIPVVVHVVYNTATENISDAQVQSQIQVLNEDFRRLNADASQTLAQFVGVAADSEFQFCLATRDPAGAPTNGITRTSTSVTSFSTNNAVKSDASGGKTGWPAASYLNMWVADLSGGLLGYAQFPGGSAATDGVVVDYQAFGRTGTAAVPFHLGRTATHEVGHWLNLRHIWGDASPSCGDDLVADTPPASVAHTGCPLTATSCGVTNMVQNYMDYSDDSCMNLFTAGQKSRMQALFAPGGARQSILSSNGCAPATPLYQVNQTHSGLNNDGLQGTSGSAAVSAKCVGQSGVLNFLAAASNVGLPYDTAVNVVGLVAANAGGVSLPDGQIVNMQIPGMVFLNSGTAVASLLPWPGNFSVPYTSTVAGVISLQKIQVTPSVALGLALSQGVQVTTTTGGTFPAGPTGDDTSTTVPLGAATCTSNVVFYGTSYASLGVSSNGRVILGGVDNDFSPSLTEAVADLPSVGFWTDLDPSVGGSITISAPAPNTIRIAYNQVRYFGETVANSFAIEFNTALNTVTLDGLAGIQVNPQSGTITTSDRQFLGISRGQSIATDNGGATFTPGTSANAINGTAMLYQFYNPPTQTGGLTTALLSTPLNRIVFTPIGNGNYSWTAF